MSRPSVMQPPGIERPRRDRVDVLGHARPLALGTRTDPLHPEGDRVGRGIVCQSRRGVNHNTRPGEGLRRRCREAGHDPPSDPQEQLPPVHPEEDEPEDQEHGRALEERLVRRAEEREDVTAEVGPEAARDEVFDQVAEDSRRRSSSCR